MSEEKDGGALETQTPLSEIVDKPRHADAPRIADVAVPEPKVEKPKVEEKPAIPHGYVPLRETLDERDRRKKAEEERDYYKKTWQDSQAKLAADAEKDPAPDMFKNPTAYSEWIDRQVNKKAEAIAKQHVAPIMERVSDQTLRLSEMAAEKHLGPEKFTKLNEWIKAQGQQFNDWCVSQPDPYHAAYEQYRQRTTSERLGADDIDTYEQKLRDKLKAEILAELKGPIDDPETDIDEQPTPRKQAPSSFASARSADPARDKGGRFAGPRPLGELVAEKDQRRKR